MLRTCGPISSRWGDGEEKRKGGRNSSRRGLRNRAEVWCVWMTLDVHAPTDFSPDSECWQTWFGSIERKTRRTSERTARGGGGHPLPPRCPTHTLGPGIDAQHGGQAGAQRLTSCPAEPPQHPTKNALTVENPDRECCDRCFLCAFYIPAVSPQNSHRDTNKKQTKPQCVCICRR